MILAPDDIQIGNYVTVHSVCLPFRDRRGQRPQSLPGDAIITAGPPVPAGVPLRILAESLPFVLCSVLEPGGTEAGPAIIDIRTIRLAPVSDAYVDALRQFCVEEDNAESALHDPDPCFEPVAVRDRRESPS